MVESIIQLVLYCAIMSNDDIRNSVTLTHSPNSSKFTGFEHYSCSKNYKNNTKDVMGCVNITITSTIEY